jgi:hypothetical protein
MEHAFLHVRPASDCKASEQDAHDDMSDKYRPSRDDVEMCGGHKRPGKRNEQGWTEFASAAKHISPFNWTK